MINPILTILQSLYDLGVGRLTLYHLEERHQEELVLGELLQVGHSVVQCPGVQHCRHVVLVSSSGYVSEPHVDTFHVVFCRYYL